VYEIAVMSEIINRELGGPKAVAEHFEYINPEPLASASIAQVLLMTHLT
jgi:predicted unusual protein kinase regulating ubiquinone biosynthesis (AarF/ABC1/UbiB family)